MYHQCIELVSNRFARLNRHRFQSKQLEGILSPPHFARHARRITLLSRVPAPKLVGLHELIQIPLDDIDMRAVRLLARSGRMTWAELAQHLGLSSPATAERVRRLEERGIIGGYGALVARDVLGFGITAFIAVDLAHASHRASFLSRMQTTREVLECHHITGDHEYLLKVACRTPLHLESFLNDALKFGDEVARTRTVIVLGTPKETLFVPPE